jgi:sensor histidine kinase YesM
MADLSRQVSVAELKTMQAQVEPHFLFNSLASLQQLIRHDPALAERFLGEFHDYLRLALPSMRESLSTVEKELALARAYLTVMTTRLGGRLQFDVQLAPDCATHPMPPLMLPTLVENAVQHGIEPKAQGGRVEITARRVDQMLQVEVCDTGIGLLAAAQHKSKGQGLGLANVRDRLASLYDGAAHITVQERDGGGVCARIDLPWAVDPMLTQQVA